MQADVFTAQEAARYLGVDAALLAARTSYDVAIPAIKTPSRGVAFTRFDLQRYFEGHYTLISEKDALVFLGYKKNVLKMARDKAESEIPIVTRLGNVLYRKIDLYRYTNKEFSGIKDCRQYRLHNKGYEDRNGFVMCSPMEAVSYVGCSTNSLSQWRYSERPPDIPFFTPGKRTRRYEMRDLKEFLLGWRVREVAAERLPSAPSTTRSNAPSTTRSKIRNAWKNKEETQKQEGCVMPNDKKEIPDEVRQAVIQLLSPYYSEEEIQGFLNTGDLADNDLDMPTLITKEKAAEILGVSKYTVLRMCKSHELKAHKIGYLWRIDANSLRKLIAGTDMSEP